MQRERSLRATVSCMVKLSPLKPNLETVAETPWNSVAEEGDEAVPAAAVEMPVPGPAAELRWAQLPRGMEQTPPGAQDPGASSCSHLFTSKNKDMGYAFQNGSFRNDLYLSLEFREASPIPKLSLSICLPIYHLSIYLLALENKGPGPLLRILSVDTQPPCRTHVITRALLPPPQCHSSCGHSLAVRWPSGYLWGLFLRVKAVCVQKERVLGWQAVWEQFWAHAPQPVPRSKLSNLPRPGRSLLLPAPQSGWDGPGVVLCGPLSSNILHAQGGSCGPGTTSLDRS